MSEQDGGLGQQRGPNLASRILPIDHRLKVPPQVLAAVRNTVIQLLGDVEAKTHPETIEILQIDPEQARELIGIPQNK